MIHRQIGKSGIKASALALGTWAVGGDAYWGSSDDAKSIEAIQAALDNGFTLIDTAPAYGFGHSEQVVGKAIAGRRSDAIISTKCGLQWDSEEGSLLLERDGKRLFRNLTKKYVKKGAEDSLKNLKTDYIDIFITHWQAIEAFPVPISETMEALLELKKEGKIRAIGISNVTPAHVEEYLKFGRVDLIQERFSMLKQQPVVKDLFPLCEKHTITLQAYIPLEQGLLAGKYTMDSVLPEGDLRNKIEWYKPENRKKVLDMLNGWKPLCERYTCSISSLVLAWTIAKAPFMNALCGGRKKHHVIENALAGDIVLTAEDLMKMNKDIAAL